MLEAEQNDSDYAAMEAEEQNKIIFNARKEMREEIIQMIKGNPEDITVTFNCDRYRDWLIAKINKVKL